MTEESNNPPSVAPLRLLLPVTPSWAGVGVWALALGALAAALVSTPAVMPIALGALGLAAALAYLLWQRPELGLVGLIFLAVGLVPAQIVDLRLPVGGLDLRDLCLLGMLGLLGVRQLALGRPLVTWRAVGLPLVALQILALSSAGYALLAQHVDPHWALNELRIIVYYATFFLAAWAISSERQLVIVLAGLFALADLVAAIIILQQFSGAGSLILDAMATGSGWYIIDQGGGGFGAVRIVPPAQVLAVAMMVVAFCLMLLRSLSGRLRIALLLQFMFLNFGLLLTYTRGQWIASALALAISALLLPRGDKLRLVRYGAVAAALLLTLSGLFAGEIGVRGANFASALGERAASIFAPRETLESASLQWRVFESERALESIAAHPLLGVGLGNSYRRVTLLQGEARGWWGTLASGTYGRYTRYVHNSYLYVAVKMGLPGLACLLWLIGAYAIAGWRVLAGLQSAHLRRITMALLATFVAVLPWALTQAHFMQIEGTMTVGLMAGLTAAMADIDRRQAAARAGGV